MPRIDVPDGSDPMDFVWTGLDLGVVRAAGRLSHAVYTATALPLREFEAARARIAQINDCQVCLGWRTARDVVGRAEDADPPDEEFYAHIGVDPGWSGFSERERLAAEFAERFATDHLGMDDDLWARLHEHFTDTELVELAICCGSHLAFGRLNRVFDIDGACRVPSF